MNFFKLFFFFFLLCLSSIFITTDFPKINYENAFNQSKIYEKHADLLERLGVAQHLRQATAMPPAEKTKFPWDEYEVLNFRARYKHPRKFIVTDNEVTEIKDEKNLDPWDPIYGECYPFPWGRYYLLKEERLKEINKKYHSEDSLYDAYRKGLITDKEYYEINDEPNNPKRFELDCLHQLEWERLKLSFISIGKTTTKSLFKSIVALVTVSLLSDTKSDGSKAFLLGGIGSAFYGLNEIVDPIAHLAFPEESLLHELELKFAKNKCFIDPLLWPRIIQGFISAHEDRRNLQEHLDFLKFALDFTIYKPKPDIQCAENRSITDVKNELDSRIDNFFKDYQYHYENTDDGKEKAQDAKNKAVAHIKSNVSAFIDSLSNKQAQAPSYLYLHGPGGIGKTHFVQALVQWIDELMPNTIGFENIQIDSVEKLRGSSKKPSIFLDVLRNQLAQNQRGSVVFIDESCSCVNNSSMISAIKDAFNENCTKLSVAYFATSPNNTIKLKVPPMLVIFAGNTIPSDKAFVSRMTMVDFLLPDTSELTKEAFAIAEKRSESAKQIYPINEKIISAWIQKLPAEHRNFRYVKKNIVIEVESMLKKNNSNVTNSKKN